MSGAQVEPTEIEQAADLLRHARYAVLLSGAGFSTPSGIPDFRSPVHGLWQNVNPMEAVSLTNFYRQPEKFFDWFRPLAHSIWKARPNAAHEAVAELECRGILRAVVTQNIDGLHQAAGSKNVYELHGSTRTLSCQGCESRFPASQFYPAYIADGIIPHCPKCSALLKPDIVFFEEMLPMDAWEELVACCSSCDVLLVVGSSLEVSPASQLPMLAIQNGAHLVINNRTPTYMDRKAELVIREDLENVIPAITSLLI